MQLSPFSTRAALRDPHLVVPFLPSRDELAEAADQVQDRDPDVARRTNGQGHTVHGLLFQGMDCCFLVINR